MKLSSKKKKTDQHAPSEDKMQNLIEPPKNLLPEHAEAKDETTVVDEAKLPQPAEAAPDSVQAKPEVNEIPADEEAKASDSEVISAEEKPAPEQKADLPMVDDKTSEVKDDVIAPAVETVSAEPSPPPTQPSGPISVPISSAELSSLSDKPNNSKLIMIGLSVFFLLLISGAGWLYFSKKSEKQTTTTKASGITRPTIPTAQPTKVASDEVKLNKYQIRVLNGSGITGEASKMKDILEKEGFKVGETGNADNYDYKETKVLAKKTVEQAFLEKLKAVISKTYVLSKENSASESSILVVIVGSKKVEK